MLGPLRGLVRGDVAVVVVVDALGHRRRDRRQGVDVEDLAVERMAGATGQDDASNDAHGGDGPGQAGADGFDVLLLRSSADCRLRICFEESVQDGLIWLGGGFAEIVLFIRTILIPNTNVDIEVLNVFLAKSYHCANY